MGPVRESIVKGVVAPMRDVPKSIQRPPYVGAKRAARWTGGDIHDAETVERIRVSARIAAQALAEVEAEAAAQSSPALSSSPGKLIAHFLTQTS